MSKHHLIETFTRRRSRLFQIARRLLDNDDDAEDALQEAFCRLWPNAEKLKDDTETDKIAVATVKILSIDHLRHQNTHPTEGLEGLEDKFVLGVENEDEHERKERYDAVKQLIDSQLSPLQQRILKWHDMEGKSYTEIAHREHMQEPAVRMQLSRARKIIRDCYKVLSHAK